VHGDFDGNVVTCINHRWRFDALTGRGISPPSCRLARYALKVEEDGVYVDPDGEPAPPAN
jgi:toluene monooxygenase system ferredoxin subunit